MYQSAKKKVEVLKGAPAGKQLLAGLQHFTKTIGADLNKQITADIEEITKEEESLPPLGWIPQARFEPVLLQHYTSHVGLPYQYLNRPTAYYTDVSAGSPAMWLTNSTLIREPALYLAMNLHGSFFIVIPLEIGELDIGHTLD
jgi:hypothetical protein